MLNEVVDVVNSVLLRVKGSSTVRSMVFISDHTDLYSTILHLRHALQSRRRTMACLPIQLQFRL